MHGGCENGMAHSLRHKLIVWHSHANDSSITHAFSIQSIRCVCCIWAIVRAHVGVRPMLLFPLVSLLFVMTWLGLAWLSRVEADHFFLLRFRL